MPYVSIRVAGKLEREQKAEICKGVTEVIARVANRPPEAVIVFIDEESRDNISKGGVLLSDL
ncbi:MAG TPA: 4-oxalocrotonate tautomerase family protein [Proteobacteria bacterium]|nr:4-oxalocrotonate tautomerase family protein [Deltaproteobacteria bacterium]HDS15149.1 4-oxalocrotonate tautomerase family protein [Pseudomonadota bacterium]